ncbi:MAG: DUF3458 domain-containing protein [Saprospiraceae bacterium]|nr:DUF3458 domain-containing protein [Saprospiraceae bacterium]
MKNLIMPALVAASVIYFACTPKAGSKMGETPPPPPSDVEIVETQEGDYLEEEMMEYEMLDGVDVMADEDMSVPDTLAPYNASNTFVHDLKHTKIEIDFDWTKKRANGRATLTLSPWFYTTDHLSLDAKNFIIKSVKLEGKNDTLAYKYDNEKLNITLDRTYKRNEEFKVVITYVARPDERESFGGSAAITGDKGLYFINADGADPEKPRQIWTQGETESNSYWFPTVDKPNERCTQEMYITVEDKYKTLSNGLMVSSKKNANGTRTDYWKMDKPHAPYLFMMAIGEFAVVKDKWRDIELTYYVEPKYEAYAKDIYPYTPEMLELFSTKLGYNYPWSKYAQVVVRDYVSGAMENTTAVIFGEFMQKNKRELLDDHLTNEKVVAHEMFHHWFGDLVTTENWANLTMNEGFANYSEYMWLEHKYGRDAADYHEYNEQQGYIFSAADGGHPLIHFGYEDKESMFDAHSYNKGGAALHMLRDLLGDEAFFASLNRYLKDNQYTDVEAHELRLAVEDVTGRDMNWFFNQWYFGAGHPNLVISYDWDNNARTASVTIEQTQTGENVAPIFQLPLQVDVYDASGAKTTQQIVVTKRNQTFTFGATSKPALINVDASKSLLCVKDDRHTPEEWAFMFKHAPLFRDRWEALEALQQEESPLSKDVVSAALNDKFWAIRERALEMADLSDPAQIARLAAMAENDPQPSTRATAIAKLSETEDAQYAKLYEKGLASDQPYSVVTQALTALSAVDPAAAAIAAQNLKIDNSEGLVVPLAELFAEKPDRANLDFYQKNATKIDYLGAFAFFDAYQRYLVGLNDQAITDAGVLSWKGIALNTETSQWRRFSATKAIADVRNALRENNQSAKAEEYSAMLTEIKSKEKDETLKMYYDMF